MACQPADTTVGIATLRARLLPEPASYSVRIARLPGRKFMSKDVVIELVSESETELAAADLAPGEAVLTNVDATTRRSPAQNATFTGRPSISTNSSGSSEGLTQRSIPRTHMLCALARYTLFPTGGLGGRRCGKRVVRRRCSGVH